MTPDRMAAQLDRIEQRIHSVDVKVTRVEERFLGLAEKHAEHVTSDNEVENRVDALEKKQTANEARDAALVSAQQAASTAKRSAIGGAAAGIVAFLYALFDMLTQFGKPHP